MIKINHIALNVNDIDYMKEFYCKMFNLQANNLYVNYKKKIQCYFLSFNSGFTRLELLFVKIYQIFSQKVIHLVSLIFHFQWDQEKI